MVSTLALAILSAPNWSAGNTWQYTLTTQYQNANTNFSEEESFNLALVTKRSDGYDFKVTRKLQATIVDGTRVPTAAGVTGETFDAKYNVAGQLTDWNLASNPVESRFQRILIGCSLPSPVKRYETRLTESAGIPTAYIVADRNPQFRELIYDFSYRELPETKILGSFELTPQFPLPKKMIARIERIQIPGGSEFASCTLTLALKQDKIDKS
ncbi:MAG TPA: hypothetical protein VK171_00170 [Fimbriimonas sp.]|nr:hypothetical protein [Fimbriimonas sp.]